MFDMFKMMGQVKELQQKMKQAQQSVTQLTEEAESGAGMVKATVNGKRQVIKLEIDDSLYQDKEMLNDLVIAAVNVAIENIEFKIKEHIQKETEGVLPNIPGLDLNSMFNG